MRAKNSLGTVARCAAILLPMWAATGQNAYVFRIGGTVLGKFLSNPHINLWPPSWRGGPPKP